MSDIFAVFGTLISGLFAIEIPYVGSFFGLVALFWFLVFIGWCIRTLLGSNIDK